MASQNLEKQDNPDSKSSLNGSKFIDEAIYDSDSRSQGSDNDEKDSENSEITQQQKEEEDNNNYESYVFIPDFVDANYTNIESIRNMNVGLSEVNMPRGLDYLDNAICSPINYGIIDHFHKAVKYCLWTGLSTITKMVQKTLKFKNHKLILFFMLHGYLIGIAEATSIFNINQSFGLWENMWFGYFTLKWLYLCNYKVEVRQDQINFKDVFQTVSAQQNLAALNKFSELDQKEQVNRNEIKSNPLFKQDLAMMHRVWKWLFRGMSLFEGDRIYGGHEQLKRIVLSRYTTVFSGMNLWEKEQNTNKSACRQLDRIKLGDNNEQDMNQQMNPINENANYGTYSQVNDPQYNQFFEQRDKSFQNEITIENKCQEFCFWRQEIDNIISQIKSFEDLPMDAYGLLVQLIELQYIKQKRMDFIMKEGNINQFRQNADKPQQQEEGQKCHEIFLGQTRFDKETEKMQEGEQANKNITALTQKELEEIYSEMLKNNVMIHLFEGRFDKHYNAKKKKQKQMKEAIAKEENIIKNFEFELDKNKKQGDTQIEPIYLDALLRKAMELEKERKDELNNLEQLVDIGQNYKKKLNEMRKQIQQALSKAREEQNRQEQGTEQSQPQGYWKQLSDNKQENWNGQEGQKQNNQRYQQKSNMRQQQNQKRSEEYQISYDHNQYQQLTQQQYIFQQMGFQNYQPQQGYQNQQNFQFFYENNQFYPPSIQQQQYNQQQQYQQQQQAERYQQKQKSTRNNENQQNQQMYYQRKNDIQPPQQRGQAGYSQFNQQSDQSIYNISTTDDSNVQLNTQSNSNQPSSKQSKKLKSKKKQK